ncbi:MAG TPA: DUF6603 domain-containing protein [Pyrinomonadaceae bacterium]|nr:DUF6603 domain-containing protein [Pyrinomonadaceae bacterium]
MDQNFQEKLLNELLTAFGPLVVAVNDPTKVFQIFETLGWDIKTILGPNSQPFIDNVTNISNALAVVAQQTNAPPQTLDDLATALRTVKSAVEALQALPSSLGGVQLQVQELNKLPVELIENLFVFYLYRRAPVPYQLLTLLRVIDEEARPQIVLGQNVIRKAGGVGKLNTARIAKLLADPVKELKAVYSAQALATQRDANALALVLFRPLADLLKQLGADTLVFLDGDSPQLTQQQKDLLPITLTARWRFLVGEVPGAAGFDFKIVPTSGGGPGLSVLPVGELTLTQSIGDWLLRSKATPFVGSLLIKTDRVQMPANVPPPGEVKLSFSLTKQGRNGGAPALRVGSTQGTRLEVGRLQVTGKLGLSASRQDYEVMAEAGSAALIVAAGDGDGFLQQVLPRDGLRTAFELAFGWSNLRGFYFRGSAGLEATLPVQASLLGLLSVDSVYLAVQPKGADVQVVTAATASVKLGPVTAVIERTGLQATFSFPPGGGNLGPAEMSLTFQPPKGAGLSIEAGAVVGGGYLFFDAQKEQYAGILQLELAQTVAIKAVGLLTTRMPDGTRGFSLLIILTAEGFAPIQLGFGFTLTGIGGLLGVNRTAAVDVLRNGIKTGTLGSILFPADPVRNAQRIVSDVGTVFPPAPGRCVFGPMAIIEWGTPSLLKLELGVVLEVPEPVRLLILGRLKATLPDEKNALVQICMDALGVLDFAAGQLSLDATLYDSRLLNFVLTGDMALRLSWGRDPSFLLAIGGWNPRFTAPADFPRPARMALVLSGGDDARLRLESYLAVTSNTLQFGARVDFYFAVQPFSVEGLLGFDALIHFNPFSFITDLSASVALRMKGTVLTCVQLNMTLAGPSPWHVWGTAQFSILSVKQSITFDAQFGPDLRPAPPAPVDVKALLGSALNDARNWSSELPAGERPLVTLRAQAPAANMLRVHPLSEVAVRERVVPLDRAITKFGNAPVTGEKTFQLKAVRSDNGQEIPVNHVNDSFALAQFVELSDDQKLAAPAFTNEHAGIRFAAGGFAFGHEPALDAAITYETLLVVPEQPAQPLPPYTMPSGALEAAAHLGAAAQAATLRAEGPRLRLG